MDGYQPKLHALTGEAHGAAALNVPRLTTMVGWDLASAASPMNPWGFCGKWRTIYLSHEKNPLSFCYAGWLIGILVMVYYNPYITGEYNPLYNPTNQVFFHCSFDR